MFIFIFIICLILRTVSGRALKIMKETLEHAEMSCQQVLQWHWQPEWQSWCVCLLGAQSVVMRYGAAGVIYVDQAYHLCDSMRRTHDAVILSRSRTVVMLSSLYFSSSTNGSTAANQKGNVAGSLGG